MTAMKQDNRHSGQAIVEFVVALVAIMVLVAGMLQIGRLTREHMQMMNRSREMADLYGFADDYQMMLPGPAYISDWNEGPDGVAYSADDRHQIDDESRFWRNVVVHAHPEDLEALMPSNEVSALDQNYDLGNAFGLVRGADTSDPIPLFPVVQHLIYDAESVRVEAEAWSVWLKGIY